MTPIVSVTVGRSFTGGHLQQLEHVVIATAKPAFACCGNAFPFGNGRRVPLGVMSAAQSALRRNSVRLAEEFRVATLGRECSTSPGRAVKKERTRGLSPRVNRRTLDSMS